MNIFIETSIVNNILDLDETPQDPFSKRQKECLEQILEEYSKGTLSLFVNPSVLFQINNTTDEERKSKLLLVFNRFNFHDFTTFVFPLTFPLHFLTKEQNNEIDNICNEHPQLKKDRKMIADVAFNDNIDVLLTTDKDLARQVRRIGLVKFMLPCELVAI
jgi:hypothetical protein